MFLRGKGPLKNTSDVISAAKKIAEAGSRMDKLGRTIADQVSVQSESNARRRSDRPACLDVLSANVLTGIHLRCFHVSILPQAVTATP